MNSDLLVEAIVGYNPTGGFFDSGEDGGPVTEDDIGDQGQWLFCLLMTELCGRNDPYFRPRFLGDKFPTFDYIVELVDHPAYYFFVQVKGTTKSYTKRRVRLKVKVGQTDVDRMVACPAPTYVVGIDVWNRRGFVLSVNEARGHVSSLITNFEINCNVLQRLYNEVFTYWSSRSMVLTDSHFRE